VSRRSNDKDDPEALLAAYRALIAEVYELAGVSRRTSDELARELGQTAARWHLMSVLSEGPRSVSRAADRLGLARQSVQRVADELTRDGLATSTPDPDDARAPKIGLTAAGRQTTKKLFARSGDLRARQLARSGLSSSDLDAARRTLRSLCGSIGA
jgi:DNA-binding MarR family transcriptional regulator